MSTISARAFLGSLVCVWTVLTGCATRKPISSTQPSFRLQSMDSGPVLFAPNIPNSQSSNLAVTLTFDGNNRLSSIPTACTSQVGPFRFGPVEGSSPKIQVVLPATGNWLRNLELRSQANAIDMVESFYSFLADLDRSQQVGCFDPSVTSVRDTLLQSMPMRPSESLFNGYGYRLDRRGLDLKPGLRLKIERAYFRPATAGQDQHSTRNYLGLSTVRFDVEPARNGKVQFEQVSTVEYSPEFLKKVGNEGQNDLGLRDLEGLGHYRLLFYTYVVPTQDGISAAVIGARTAGELDELEDQLRTHSESGCKGLPSNRREDCFEFTGFVTVSAQIKVELNGKPKFMEWGSNVHSVVPPRDIKSLTIQRQFLNSYYNVTFDPSSSDVLSLALVGGDRLNWYSSGSPTSFKFLKQSANTSTPSSPPIAPVKSVTENYYGTKIIDPYRYMENLDDPNVQFWFEAQNDYARTTLARLPARQKLWARIIELDQSTPADVTSVRRLPGDRYIYTKLLAGEDTYKLYIRKGLQGEERQLVDPERITVAKTNRRKGANVIDYFAPSDDLRYVAVAVTPGGSEYDTEVHVIEVATGHETGDVIGHCCGHANPFWLPDNHSFVYGRWQKLPPGAPVTETREKYLSYLHVLGTDQERDQAVFGFGVVPSIEVDPRHFASVRTEPDSKYALGIIGTPVVSPNSAFYITAANTIGEPNAVWRKVADFSDDVADIAIHGDDLYLLTYKNALRYKIVHTNTLKPDLSAAETVVATSEAVIEEMSAADDALYVRVLDGGISRVLRVSYDTQSKVEQIELPLNGAASFFDSDLRVRGALFSLYSWTRAPKIYAYDPATKRVSDTLLQPSGPYDEFADVEAEELKVPSHDGTLVPLSITHPKGMKLNGTNPTLLSAYGAYGISMSPEFDQTYLAWYERGGVKATCHVRGGGEYGEEWHQAGKGPTKPNSWLDFIACAQFLVDKRYTSPAFLAGEGASAGGLLLGRAITERPDLFAAAIIYVGGVDMLRIDTTANGGANIQEFGTTKNEEGFRALYAMSPLQHIKDGTPYPAVLLTTGINDARVNPWQPGKLAARLQVASSSGKPVLLYVDFEAGHGGTTEKGEQEELANAWSFALWQFGVSDFQPRR